MTSPGTHETTPHGGTCPAPSQQKLPRILQLFTFYEDYLHQFYSIRKALSDAPHDVQLQELYHDGFAACHVFAPYLKKLGHDVSWVIANNPYSQVRWALDHGIAFDEQNWRKQIVRAQIEHYQPDVLYTMNPLEFDSGFIKTISFRPEIVVGWRAAVIPPETDWSSFDLILSHLTVCREQSRAHGARAAKYFHPAVPAWLPNLVSNVHKQFDVVFAGQWSGLHTRRNKIIVDLAEAAERNGFSLGLFLCCDPKTLPPVVAKFNHGARWGREMYRALASGRIVVNAEVDLAVNEAGNLRLFESTAVGAMLLQQRHPNVSAYLEPEKECVTFSDSQELAQKISYYLTHNDDREAIARAGQRRITTEFGMEKVSRTLSGIFGELQNPTGNNAPTSSSIDEQAIIALINAGQIDAAIRQLEPLINEGRASPGLLYPYAVALSRAGRINDAATVLERFLSAMPDHADARTLRDTLQRQSSAGKQSHSVLIDAVIEKLRSGHAESALQLIEQADRRVPFINHVRALCLIELNRNQEATAALNAELAVDPNNAAARELLNELTPRTPSTPPPSQAEAQQKADKVISDLQNGRGVDAMRGAGELAQLLPQTPGVHYLHTVALNAVGRHEEALEAAKRELAINPGHGGARAEFETLSKALARNAPPQLHPEQRSYNSALDKTTLASIQKSTHRYTYRGVPMIKNPFDFALYPLLLWDMKPRTIIEIGSKNGGSALWFGDMCNNFGLDTHIYSIDIVKVRDVSHPRVTFMEGNGRDLGAVVTKQFLDALPRPLLVIEDADHSYETSSAVLAFFHKHLRGDEVIVIEDGIITDLQSEPNFLSGPHRALKEFLAAHPGEYDSASQYSDFFGYNYTWCSNGFLKRKRHALNPAVDRTVLVDFLKDDPAPHGVESQMSLNERFQLYSAARSVITQSASSLRFVEVGSFAGASLTLVTNALKQSQRPFHAIAVEPEGRPQFYEVVGALGRNVTHLKSFSHPARDTVANLLQQHGGLAQIIFIDGDHSYEGVKQDMLDYYPLLAPGGIIVFHDYLPELNDENRQAIFFHHAGNEPGIRRACHEVMEAHFKADRVDLPLPYPTDTTQTQPHLPVIPGVYSTIRAYRKPA